MPEARYVGPSSFHTRPLRIFLVRSIFAERSGPLEEPKRLSGDQGILVGIGLFRPSYHRLIISLTVEVEEDAPFDLDVTYAVEFEMNEEVADEDQDYLWKHVAAHVAPGLLYPYVREAVTHLTSRWRGDTFSLPLIPLPALPEDEIAIPAPPENSDRQGVLPLNKAMG